MLFGISKKFLIFEKTTFLIIFSEKNREKFQKNLDWAGKEKVVSTGQYTGR